MTRKPWQAKKATVARQMIPACWMYELAPISTFGRAFAPSYLSAVFKQDLTPRLTGARARSAEGTNTGHKNGEAMASVGVRVEPTVRLRRVGRVWQFHQDLLLLELKTAWRLLRTQFDLAILARASASRAWASATSALVSASRTCDNAFASDADLRAINQTKYGTTGNSRAAMTKMAFWAP
jgi:hypothetical protein